jgi:hypothetical protein
MATPTLETLPGLRVRECPDEPSSYAAGPGRRRRDLIALMGEVIADGVARTSPPRTGSIGSST